VVLFKCLEDRLNLGRFQPVFAENLRDFVPLDVGQGKDLGFLAVFLADIMLGVATSDVGTFVPDNPAASANGTVRPSAMPITISRTSSLAVK
jgi:hypothetical protein